MLRRSLWKVGEERGQALMLAALAMVALLGFAAMSIDVGYWYSQKREVQNAVDAAALAGAQELPDDYLAARAKGLEYLEGNGVSTANGDTISITFRCTSTYQIACNPATNHWDTMVVEVERPLEAWFARLVGIDQVLVKDVRAAGCNGPCGGSAFQPLEVVQILDRTGSMTTTDLTHVKDAAKALLEYFQPSLQRVGLGVLGPSSTTTTCTGAYAPALGRAADTGTWLPVLLKSDYQNPNGSLNTSSLLVKTINCLDTSSVGTDLGDPMKVATDYLQANGRSDVKWGIVLLTDGAANAMPAYDTGYRSPTAQAKVSNPYNGDGDGFQFNPTNAYADGGSYAEDRDSSTNDHTTCGDTGKDRHDFYNYGISVPSGNEIKGIEVRLDAWIDSTSGASTRRMCVQLSWDNGATWTTVEHKISTNLTTSQQTYILGGNGDTWGRTWTLSELSDANFRVRITNVSNKSSPYIRDFYLDWAAVKVYYGPAASGACDYAAKQADAAKALNPPIEIFTIGYGVGSGDLCTDSSGAWKNKNAAALLTYMATDASHFFNDPSKGDLRPIFEVIGYRLAGGSRLVE